MRRIPLWVLVLCPLLMSCAHPGANPGPDQDNQLITEEEIVASHAATAYDAVKLLRANFLSYRGKTSVRESGPSPVPTVFLDGQEFGPMLSLKTIPAVQVVEIRLYRSWEASTKFGAAQMGGVIEVITRH